MTPTSSLPAIPWAHETSDFGSVWVWETPHFIVTVNGDARSCYYQIADKSARPDQPPAPLADGQAATFEQAEQLIRETIGKSYKPTLGYGHYAGPLATTFRIGTGSLLDLAPYANHEVDVTTIGPDGNDVSYRGKAKISHYELLLDTGALTIRISPTYLRTINLVGRNTMQAPVARPVNRTVQGTLEPGCTGRPGFMPGTIEHVGLVCRIHEERV